MMRKFGFHFCSRAVLPFGPQVERRQALRVKGCLNTYRLPQAMEQGVCIALLDQMQDIRPIRSGGRLIDVDTVKKERFIGIDSVRSEHDGNPWIALSDD